MALERRPVLEHDALHSDHIAALFRDGIEAAVVTDEDNLRTASEAGTPDLVLLDVAGMTGLEVTRCVGRCSQIKLPVLAIVPNNRVPGFETPDALDDFVVGSAGSDEVVRRAKRILDRAGSGDGQDVVRVGDLIINPTNYEVSVKGRRVNLRFKEYELLLLMAANPGRVFTRDALLERIWGYDYLGGTRTVDVHIRRLRSKIEDAGNSFIETVWQVGYRFRDSDSSR